MPIAPSATTANSCRSLRLSHDDRDDLAIYGGGFEVLRGGKAKCIVKSRIGVRNELCLP